MLKILRADGYKLIHSVMMLIYFGVVFLLLFIHPIMILSSTESLYMEILQVGYLNIASTVAPMIFAVLFVGRDFGSGSIKNTYQSSNKVAYVFSKVIYILAFCVIVELVYFVLMLIFASIGSIQINDPTNKVPPKVLYLDMFFRVIASFSMGTMSMLLVILLRHEYIVLPIMLVYFFVSSIIYSMIGSSIGDDFAIFRYITQYSDWVTNEVILMFKSINKINAVRYVANIVFYSSLFTGFSILTMYKRKAV